MKWRCFFCDFETDIDEEAAAHFGDRDDPEEFKPICKWWQRMSTEERVGEFQVLIQELNGERDEGGRLLDALREIIAVASGEKQVAQDDTEGMAWIDKRARQAMNL